MNVSNVASLATSISNQKMAVEASFAVAKLANKQVEAQGQSALELIAAVAKPQGSLGHNIDVRA